MEIMKIFSDSYDEERLYSVLLSEEEMDLYEAIFSSEDEDEEELPKKKMSKGKKAAIASGATAATAAGAVVGGKYAGKAILSRAEKIRNKAIEAGEFGGKEFKKNARMVNIGKNLQKPADAIVGASKKAGKFIADNAKKITKVVKK